MKTKQLTISAMGLLFLILCAKISLPITVIPLTLQTMGVIFLGLLLDVKTLSMIYGCYYVMGFLGLPVFASGGGFAYFLMPSCGFLLAFYPASLLLSYGKKHFSYLGAMLCALLLIYGFGVFYMGLIFTNVMGLQKSLYELLKIGVLPFLANDLISGSLALIGAKRLHETSYIQKQLSS